MEYSLYFVCYIQRRTVCIARAVSDIAGRTNSVVVSYLLPNHTVIGRVRATEYASDSSSILGWCVLDVHFRF